MAASSRARPYKPRNQGQHHERGKDELGFTRHRVGTCQASSDRMTGICIDDGLHPISCRRISTWPYPSLCSNAELVKSRKAKACQRGDSKNDGPLAAYRQVGTLYDHEGCSTG